jgi:hypothetical protein
MIDDRGEFARGSLIVVQGKVSASQRFMERVLCWFESERALKQLCCSPRMTIAQELPGLLKKLICRAAVARNGSEGATLLPVGAH